MDDFFESDFDADDVDLKENKVNIGTEIDMMEKDPTLRRLHVGFGWDLVHFEQDAVDLDVSVFLIGKDNKTRVDDDFIFYNNMEVLDGGIKHNGDSRTGAGDGDDESITIDLHAVPFDVMSIVFAVSIYKGHERGHNMDLVKNVFMRIGNADTHIELLRYEMDDVLKERKETAFIAAHLNREGPKWWFVPKDDFVQGGLAAIASDYGIIVAHQ